VSYEDVLTNAVDDLVPISRGTRVLGHAAGEGEGGGVQEPPTSLVTPVVIWTLSTALDVSDFLQADDLAAVHLHDGLVRTGVGEQRAAVQVEGFVLRLALQGQWLDDLGNEAWEIALEVRRVFALDDVVAVLITDITGLSTTVSQTLCD